MNKPEAEPLKGQLENAPPQTGGASTRGTDASKVLVTPYLVNQVAQSVDATLDGRPSAPVGNGAWAARDQFVKHTLKIRHYIRFVDDLVLLCCSHQQLLQWHRQIAKFLQAQLGLQLRDDVPVLALRDGLDFLGYWVFATHLLVGHQAANHCREVLVDFEQTFSTGLLDPVTGECVRTWRSNRPDCFRLSQQIASYRGHFGHAKSWRLQQKLLQRYGWLPDVLKAAASAGVNTIATIPCR